MSDILPHSTLKTSAWLINEIAFSLEPLPEPSTLIIRESAHFYRWFEPQPCDLRTWDLPHVVCGEWAHPLLSPGDCLPSSDEAPQDYANWSCAAATWFGNTANSKIASKPLSLPRPTSHFPRLPLPFRYALPPSLCRSAIRRHFLNCIV